MPDKKDVPDSLSTDDAINRLLQVPGTLYYLEQVAWEVFKKSKASVMEAAVALNLGSVSWSRNEFHGLIISKKCEDRKDFMEKCELHGFPPDVQLRKNGSVTADGLPKTQISAFHQFTEFDGIPVWLMLHYTRDGTPGAKCKVVPRLYYDVVCSLS